MRPPVGKVAFEGGYLFGKSTGFVGNGFGRKILQQCFEFRIVRFIKRTYIINDFRLSVTYFFSVLLPKRLTFIDRKAVATQIEVADENDE